MSRALESLLSGPVEDIAPRLLGLKLRTEFPPGPTEVVITEVEAYAGWRDPASHAYRGQTPRNVSMFGPSGTLYVYRSYGIHWCMNIVTGGYGDPSAVLLRGGVPAVGELVMMERRGRRTNIADGPGKLTQALGVSGREDGTSVWDGPVRLTKGASNHLTVEATPRVGISRATEWRWRFVSTLADQPSAQGS